MNGIGKYKMRESRLQHEIKNKIAAGWAERRAKLQRIRNYKKQWERNLVSQTKKLDPPKE